MTITTGLSRLIALAALIITVLHGVARAAREVAGPAAPSVTDIMVSFKLDPRLTRAVYMGERWVSPSTYTGVREGKEITVDARAKVIAARGRATGIRPKWIVADPEMVTITPNQGNEVKINVRRAGQSSLKVAAPGFSRELSIKAAYQGSAIQVEISQKQPFPHTGERGWKGAH